VARLDAKIADVARQFVLVRRNDMRGVDLNVFEFDYDLTWAGFFLNPDQEIYGRYGGRDASSPDSRMSLAGLRHALLAALEAHRRHDPPSSPRAAPQVRSVEQYAAAGRRPANACIHCHQVYDFHREAMQAEGKWRLDDLWVYPLPEKAGLTLNVDAGDQVQAVAPDSAASRAGLRSGDRLRTLNGVAISSIADVQYALHRAPVVGSLPVTWSRNQQPFKGQLEVHGSWRQTDLSWRWSLRSLEPLAWVQGEDLSSAQKQRLGLRQQDLAFYQSTFVSTPARQAGIRQNDIILGVDHKQLEMTARQFLVYIKLNYKVGDRVTYQILRNGKRLDVPMTLVSRPTVPRSPHNHG
jgi:hypothetical protein